MNKKITVIGFLILAAVFIGSVMQFNSIDGKVVNDKNDEEETNVEEGLLEEITIGYCPTMEKHVAKLSNADESINSKVFSSASNALNALKLGSIDAVIIGRTAYHDEIGPTTQEIRLRDGYTLVGNERAFIGKEELNNIQIHTYISKEKAQEQLPANANIIVHESKNEAIEEGLKQALLIPWKDYKEEYELIIPAYPGGRKVEEFRAPVVYYNNLDERHIKNIEKIKE